MTHPLSHKVSPRPVVIGRDDIKVRLQPICINYKILWHSVQVWLRLLYVLHYPESGRMLIDRHTLTDVETTNTQHTQCMISNGMTLVTLPKTDTLCSAGNFESIQSTNKPNDLQILLTHYLPTTHVQSIFNTHYIPVKNQFGIFSSHWKDFASPKLSEGACWQM